MKTVEIYFNDLNEEKQKEFLEAVGVDDPKEMNWDINMCPLAMVNFEERYVEYWKEYFSL